MSKVKLIWCGSRRGGDGEVSPVFVASGRIVGIVSEYNPDNLLRQDGDPYVIDVLDRRQVIVDSLEEAVGAIEKMLR